MKDWTDSSRAWQIKTGRSHVRPIGSLTGSKIETVMACSVYSVRRDVNESDKRKQAVILTWKGMFLRN